MLLNLPALTFLCRYLALPNFCRGLKNQKRIFRAEISLGEAKEVRLWWKYLREKLQQAKYSHVQSMDDI